MGRGFPALRRGPQLAIDTTLVSGPSICDGQQADPETAYEDGRPSLAIARQGRRSGTYPELVGSPVPETRLVVSGWARFASGVV